MISINIDDNGHLLCPNCSHRVSSINGIVVGDGRMITVFKDKSVTSIHSDTAYTKEVSILFECELCKRNIDMTFNSHEGETWVVLDVYEKLPDETRAWLEQKAKKL